MSEPVERETQLVRPRYRREILWLLFARMLSLSRVGLSKTTIQAAA